MSYSARIKDLFKRYGKIGVAVHLSVYGATFAGVQSLHGLPFAWLQPVHCQTEPLVLAGCYYAASSNMQFEEFLTRHGLLGSTCFLPGLLCLPKYKVGLSLLTWNLCSSRGQG